MFWSEIGEPGGIPPQRIPKSLYVSGKVPTYPSPKPTLTLSSHLWQNVGLGEGWVRLIRIPTSTPLPPGGDLAKTDT